LSGIDLSLTEADFDGLRRLLERDDGSEAAAYVLCGEAVIGSDPWDRQSRRRLTVHKILPVPNRELISADGTHVTWSTDSYVKLLTRAENEDLVPGIVHTHPGGFASFSTQDDRNERDLVQLARNRNGRNGRLLSILLAGGNQIRARLWVDTRGPVGVESVRVVGGRSQHHRGEPLDLAEADHLARQALAFGGVLNQELRTMRCGVVGCGGTGSATAMVLSRLGVGQLALFDNDIVDVTNLNRLHGAGRRDADSMRPKVEVVARAITELGLGTRVVPVRSWVGDPACRDALRACDVIFGCTDDHDGRLLLNRLAYFYLIRVIDMGLAIDPRTDKAGFNELAGRVTTLLPGAPCLLCREVIDVDAALAEDLRRRSPEEYELRKREAYVAGAGDPSPAVVTFTTATACLAVDELLQAMTGFRALRYGETAWERRRRFDLPLDQRPGANSKAECRVCGSTEYWGRGDVEPFLDRVG